MEIISNFMANHPGLATIIGVLVAIIAWGVLSSIWTSTTRRPMEHDFNECPVCSRGDRCDEGMSAELGLTEEEHEVIRPHYKRPPDIRQRVQETISALPPLDLVHEDMFGRVPMNNRFIPDSEDPARADLMAAQIVADQKVAHEDPGPLTDAPAPLEPGYRAPQQRIDVTVGRFTVHLDRLAPAQLTERRKPATGSFIEVPYELEPAIATLAMEVLRLREGWSFDDGK